MTTEFSDSIVPVPGGSVFVRHWNTGHTDRTPIVLLHDALGCVDLWRDFPAALAHATARSVVAYDRLGFGRSTRRAGLPIIDFIQEEADIFFPAIAHVLGISHCILFGHSVGGAMAFVIAASHPSMCQTVITESAQAFVEQRTLAGIQAAKAAFASPEHFAKLAKWHRDKARWVLDAWTDVWLAPEFRSWSLDPHLKQVRCPVLSIHGDQDEYGSQAFPRHITENVQGPAQMDLLTACGHVPHRERKDELLRLAASFIRHYCG